MNACYAVHYKFFEIHGPRSGRIWLYSDNLLNLRKFFFNSIYILKHLTHGYNVHKVLALFKLLNTWPLGKESRPKARRIWPYNENILNLSSGGLNVWWWCLWGPWPSCEIHVCLCPWAGPLWSFSAKVIFENIHLYIWMRSYDVHEAFLPI